MSTDRSFDTHPQAHQQHGRRRQKHQLSKAPPASSSFNRTQLRKKIRDVSRLLQDTSRLSAIARAEHERALAAYQHELYRAQTDDKQKEMAQKYHMVRFFERRKATRKINTLKRRIQSEPELSTQLHNAEVDLAYILYYPPLEKYISLFKRSNTKEPKTDEKRQSIWRDIEEKMTNGSLSLGRAWEAAEEEEEVMEKHGIHEGVGQRTSTKRKKDTKDKWGNKKRYDVVEDVVEEAGEHGDGGFFEF